VISIDSTGFISAGFISTAKMTDLPVVSACFLGFSGSELAATGLSGTAAVRQSALSGLPVLERNDRPAKALVAGKAAAEAKAYALAAASAKTQQQTTQHHKMWAFRGLEPWSDPA
jgi:succinyl-CoA synthetase alpha subunit